MSDRRVPPGGGILIGIVLGLLLWLSLIGLAVAQDSTTTPSKFLVAVDTAGISAVPGSPNVYTTWVFALSTPKSFPSAGILVEWNCASEKVRRVAQIKYEQIEGGKGYRGDLVEVNGPWVAITNRRMYDLVCRIGPQHVEADAWKQDSTPLIPSVPAPPKQWDGKSYDA
jgi:hypothetical protein